MSGTVGEARRKKTRKRWGSAQPPQQKYKEERRWSMLAERIKGSQTVDAEVEK